MPIIDLFACVWRQVFMHDKYSSPTRVAAGTGNDDAAMVILTKHKVFSLADDSDSE